MQERILKTDIMEIHRKGGGEMKTKKHNWKRWLPLYLMMAPGLIYIFINNYLLTTTLLPSKEYDISLVLYVVIFLKSELLL